ncbi:hypothetical protein GE09DRAFT_264755 [Coniochaeta sp. 2T2.1]|nr:hypothetical protein GE09DRAFT_264755 [Coniochaeta sp. 2T2.1]
MKSGSDRSNQISRVSCCFIVCVICMRICFDMLYSRCSILLLLVDPLCSLCWAAAVILGVSSSFRPLTILVIRCWPNSVLVFERSDQMGHLGLEDLDATRRSVLHNKISTRVPSLAISNCERKEGKTYRSGIQERPAPPLQALLQTQYFDICS